MRDEHRNAMHQGYAHQVRVSIDVGNGRGDSHGGATS